MINKQTVLLAFLLVGLTAFAFAQPWEEDLLRPRQNQKQEPNPKQPE